MAPPSRATARRRSALSPTTTSAVRSEPERAKRTDGKFKSLKLQVFPRLSDSINGSARFHRPVANALSAQRSIQRLAPAPRVTGLVLQEKRIALRVGQRPRHDRAGPVDQVLPTPQGPNPNRAIQRRRRNSFSIRQPTQIRDAPLLAAQPEPISARCQIPHHYDVVVQNRRSHGAIR